MNKILIRGVEVSACHGVNGFEKVEPQRFVFDADITADFYAAAQSDDLEGTVNYSSFCKLITAVTTENTFNLIEKLAYECVFAAFEKFPLISAISLTVWKPDAPMNRKFDKVGVTVTAERERAYLSLGSSMGDRKKYLDTAIEKLNSTRGIKVEKVSDYISTKPYGGVAEIHRIEAECQRVREKRWGDRTLDIDIIFFGDKRINDGVLTVPHPDYLNRDFVKIPLKQLAPWLI